MLVTKRAASPCAAYKPRQATRGFEHSLTVLPELLSEWGENWGVISVTAKLQRDFKGFCSESESI